MSKLSKFMKNALVALVACVLALGVSACGSHEEEAIRQGVDEMMAVFQNPVENDASSFVDDETLSVLEDYGIDANEYLSHCFRNLTYEIGDVTVNGDTATVSMSVTNANLMDALNVAGEEFGAFAETDEATELYQSEGEEALFAKLFEYLYANLDAEDVELTTTDVQLTLTKDEEGNWTVDSDNPEFYSAIYGGADLTSAL